MSVRNRIEVMHGVNLDQLQRRDPSHYGRLSLDELERRIEDFAGEFELVPRFFRSNHEGEFVEHLHRLDGLADAIVVNPGAWTHYSYAIRDALELAALPTVEVHLSDIEHREEFRRHSVLAELCVSRVMGQGPEGYRQAMSVLAARLEA